MRLKVFMSHKSDKPSYEYYLVHQFTIDLDYSAVVEKETGIRYAGGPDGRLLPYDYKLE